MAKVRARPLRQATIQQLATGVPLFLDQLIDTLKAEEDGEHGISLRISGPPGGDAGATSEIGIGATAHGRELLAMGFNVDQVVHDYGDLCQAITDLAEEHKAPFAVDEFRTLNRCLDNAIADAVTAFSVNREAAVALTHSERSNARLGWLAHELRNSLHSATLALTALESGGLPVSGSTGAVLRRSLRTMGELLTRAFEEVRENAHGSASLGGTFLLAPFLAEAEGAALLHARAHGCSLALQQVDSSVRVHGAPDPLMAALMNLLHNAFKFTQAGTQVDVRVRTEAGLAVIEVEDRCGGLPAGDTEVLFRPFSQRSENRSGLGLGLSIARRYVEDDGGTLTVRNNPGRGCVFCMSLRRAG
jgi:signal transduction histidine kinase